MKRSSLLLLVLLVAALCLPCLVACRTEPDPVTPPDEQDPGQSQPGQPSDQPPVSGDELTLIADGACEYRIVVSDFAKNEVRNNASSLRRTIELVTGVRPDMVTDWEDSDDNDHIKEILVGKTNRALSTEFYKEIESDEYGIRIHQNKIALIGEGDCLSLAISTFLADYFGYIDNDNYSPLTTVELPKESSYIGSLYDHQGVVLYVANDKLGYVDELTKALRSQYENLQVVTHTTSANHIFNIGKAKLVIIAGVNTMPSSSKTAINSYLANGGRILMLGGPAFETTLYELDGKWYEKSAYTEALVKELDDVQQNILLDACSTSTVSKFSDSSDNKTAMTKKIGSYGLEGSPRQLFHEISDFSSWANISIRTTVTLRQANFISFYAKPGDDHTDHFTLEIEDSRGARWYAVIPFVSEDWTHYALTPEDFTWFEGDASAKGAQPNFADTVRMRIGLASSYTKASAGHHSYYLSDVILSYVTSDLTSETVSSFSLDGVAPLYEQYPITNAASVIADDSQVFVSARDYVVPEGLISRHPGISGIGYQNEYPVRFIPLLRVTDEKGLHSGYAAWIDLYASSSSQNGTNEGSMVGYFSATTDDFYNADGIAAVVEAVEAMTSNVFIVNAGTDEHTYLKADTTEVTAGVSYVVLPGKTEGTPVVKIALYSGDRLLREYSSESLEPLSLANSVKSIEGSFAVGDQYPDRAVATITLDGKVIDRMEQAIYFWQAKPADERSFIYTEDGYFKRDGEIISFFGVNFSATYNSAKGTNEPGSYRYDPTVVYRDLLRVKDLGMNAIALWVNVDDLRNHNDTLDIIRMCEELGLYVDLSIRTTAYPLKNYSEEDVEDLIRHLRFYENDNIIAFDIAWEPRIGNYDGNWAPGDKHGAGYFIGREAWDDDFTAWAALQYGSVAAAEQAWGVKLERTAAGDLLVTDAMLDDETGKYQKAVAAYYRFIDDAVSAGMQEKMLHMEPLAPDHLISFRMSMSGSALRTSSFKPSTHCFDFQSLASTMSFMEPEGYQLGASDEQALQIMFANAYARYAQPESPVVWKEYGYHVWSNREDGNFYPNEAQQQMAADYYEYALKYALTSYTSGMFCWWSVSGYRVDEKSDYGIYNPDGSDRPVTTLLREYAPKIIGQGEREDTVLIEIEKDDFTGGIYGMFEAVKDELAKAYAEGKHVTFINAHQEGVGQYAYADTLLDYAVADAKPENGTYPLRYVNGMVKSLTVVEKNGKTYAEAVVCNTKQSVWRAASVSLISCEDSDVSVNCVIDEELSYLDETTLTFELNGHGELNLRFEIEGVAFGPLYTTTIK